ncbi:hypothetical protein K1X84_04950 [bacterium]|nr:hypothetical protein [bacterium]
MKLFLIFFYPCLLFAQEQDALKLYYEVLDAYQNRNYSLAETKLYRLEQLIPSDTEIYYLMAQVHGWQNQKDKALLKLKQGIAMGSDFVLNAPTDSAFYSFRNDKEFIRLLKEIDALRKPVNNSIVAFTIKERDLIPEGTAFDDSTGQLFISSSYKRKVKRIYPDGSSDDFVAEKQDGLLGVVGMEVDARHRVIWVNSCRNPNMPIAEGIGEEQLTTIVHQFDLRTGQLIRKYPGPKGDHFFNDLTVDQEGNVYITDSQSGEIFWINHARDSLEIFLKPERAVFLNGITKSSDGKYLFVADALGIMIIDRVTRDYRFLKHPELIPLGGVDGLAFYDRILIAHQSGVVGRIKKFHLSPDMKNVTGVTIIEANNPHFDQATTGEIGGDWYYYIANAQLRSGFDNRKIKPYDQLKDVVILKTKLK